MGCRSNGWRTHLFTVLVGDDRAFCRARVCAEDDAVLEDASYDGGTGAGRLGQRQTLVRQKMVAERCLVWQHSHRAPRSPYRV